MTQVSWILFNFPLSAGNAAGVAICLKLRISHIDQWVIERVNKRVAILDLFLISIELILI